MTRSFNVFACGFLTGATIGAAASLLFAPKSGRELRSGIRERAERLRHEGNARYAEARERGRKAALQARDTLRATSEGLKDAARELNTGKSSVANQPPEN
jgi:gas vesicle protein